MNEKFETELNPTADTTAVSDRPEIDISKLPSLPASGSAAWRGSRRNSGRWRSMGCGCAMLMLIAAIFVAYHGVRDQVWSSYSEVQRGLRNGILADVDQDARQRLLDRLDSFDAAVNQQGDPYPAIGRFVATGRAVLADLVVDAEEADQLDQFLESEISDAVGEGTGS